MPGPDSVVLRGSRRVLRLCAATLVAALAAATLVAAAGISAASSQQARPAGIGVLDEHTSIEYATRPTTDRVSVLSRALAAGTASLTRDDRTGYLRPVLEALGVPVESQVLVFSKTGVQRDFTGPRSPRALYFDESVVVGYIAGAPLLEIAAHDPQQGVVFYALDQAATSAPSLQRETTCLTCHVSVSTLDVPGMIARSNVVGGSGEVMPQLGSYPVNHRTPLSERWGGWFVTGNYTLPQYVGVGNLSNVTVSVHPTSGPVINSNRVFIDWLNSAPDAHGYLSSDSDIAALMIFDHQMHAINLLTRLNWESRVAAASGRANFSVGMLRDFVNELADYLLFVGEVPPPATVTPRPGLAERMRAKWPTDRRGRSLGELAFGTRLLRYPCSYMVYTEAFSGLLPAAREAVYQRLWDILLGRDARAKYAHLSRDDRRAIREILRDTKPDLPADLR